MASVTATAISAAAAEAVRQRGQGGEGDYVDSLRSGVGGQNLAVSSAHLFCCG